MVLVTKGTKCRYCGEVISTRPLVGFPHFVRNRQDPLFVFSDAAFHPECFHKHPLHEQALIRLEERKERMRERVCASCGEVVKEDWYTTDHITDDTTSPLYWFNYLHFHKRHLRSWSEFERFRKLMESFEASGQYEGPPILPD